MSKKTRTLSTEMDVSTIDQEWLLKRIEQKISEYMEEYHRRLALKYDD